MELIDQQAADQFQLIKLVRRFTSISRKKCIGFLQNGSLIDTIEYLSRDIERIRYAVSGVELTNIILQLNFIRAEIQKLTSLEDKYGNEIDLIKLVVLIEQIITDSKVNLAEILSIPRTSRKADQEQHSEA